MTHQHILTAFGFITPDIPQSIYPYAPVYRVGDHVIKRTRAPLERAEQLIQWTRALAGQGVPVVTPVNSFGDNPRAFGDEVWVVYPFVHGRRYTGSTSQIHAAGNLLGRVHAAETGITLAGSATVIEIDADDIGAAQVTIRHHLPNERERVRRWLDELATRYHDALPRALAADLPTVNATWDYKASNLIYTTDQTPVLVDPDSGGNIPRLYDLAIAALLFHNDGTGSGLLFTPAEWAAFFDGYRAHVSLTEAEHAAWDDVLLCAWMDEALWLLANHGAGWANPTERPYLHNLLYIDLARFALPE